MKDKKEIQSFTKWWVYYKTNHFTKTRKLWSFADTQKDCEVLFNDNYKTYILIKCVKEPTPLKPFLLHYKDELKISFEEEIKAHSKEDAELCFNTFKPNFKLISINEIEEL